MATIAPPNEVFENPPLSARDRLAQTGYTLPNFQRVARSPGGEMLAFYAGIPIPRKGLPYTEAVFAINQVKRITLFWFFPFLAFRKGITAFLQALLDAYCSACDCIFGCCENIPYLKKEYMISTSKGVWTLISVFLEEIGITKDTADHCGKIMATILEYDDSYRMPIVDVMSKFTREEIVESPSKFVDRFIGLLASRSDNADVIGKFKKISKYIKWALKIPRYKRAFIRAFDALPNIQITRNEPTFNMLQYDIYDSFWSLSRAGYNAGDSGLGTRLRQGDIIVKNHNQMIQRAVEQVEKTI